MQAWLAWMFLANSLNVFSLSKVQARRVAAATEGYRTFTN